jgi:RNA polymerase sigma-70 factor (ECF subfamily)
MTSRTPDDGPADGSADGPADWIGLLYDRHADSLYRYAVMILADSAAASDVVQQVFLGIAGKPAGHVRAEERYLRRAVRNECYSALRRRRREADTDDSPLLEAVAIDQKLEERLAIERAIRTLPPEQREVLHLKAFDGWTFQQIADQLGESINTVASRYRYAIEKLRGQLGTSRT